MHMEKKELLLKMKEELSRYQIGFHNIGLKKYQNVLELCEDTKDAFLIDTEITEKNIAEHIMKTGLNIVKDYGGLSSTVWFFDKQKDTSLDYTYNHIELGTVWNIIAGVPNPLSYNNKEYFLGDLQYATNVGNLMLFDKRLPKEFIYGYYGRKIVDKKCENSYVNNDFIYDDVLEFYSNPEFFEYLGKEEKDFVLDNLFLNKKRALENLKAANNYSYLPLLFKTSSEKHIIQSTRKQIKEYIKSYN